MPSTSISTPVSTPSVDRLTLGVATTREGATTSNIFALTCTCAASSEGAVPHVFVSSSVCTCAASSED